jgi:acetoin utilization deacetylase AcuC-like enzyme
VEVGDRLARWRRRFARLRRQWVRYLQMPLHGSEVQWLHSRRYSVDLVWPVADLRRGERILNFLDREGILRHGDLHRTRRASMRKLLDVHDEAYLRSLETAEGLSRVVGFPIAAAKVDEVLLAQRAMVGGTVLATRLALRDRNVQVNLGGGLHHAMRDRGQGFCLFNDLAIAIHHARRRGLAGPVLVVDLDLHDGDGTRALFADDAHVHTYSVHNRTLGVEEAVASTTIELGPDVHDDLYLETIRSSLPPLVGRLAPELVFYVAGVDPAFDDRIGDWHITPEGMIERDRLVMRTVRPPGSRTPVVITLGGGYGHHAWRYSARFFAWLATGRRLEPPATADLPLAAYRRLARLLSEPVFTSTAERSEGDDWGLTEDDLPGPSPLQQQRLFGRFTVHGVELALERLGFFERVRALGHEHLRLEADLLHPLGQTLRLVSLHPAREVLFELRGRIDEQTVPQARVLFVEWLLSQNPAAEFSSQRPELSGQKHPGTGLLRDVASLLILACEQLELDGVAYVPTHVSLAVQSATLAVAVDPEEGARFDAALRAVRTESFREQVRLLEGGAVREIGSGAPYRWRPSAVVVPVSRALRRRLEAAKKVPAFRFEFVARADDAS